MSTNDSDRSRKIVIAIALLLLLLLLGGIGTSHFQGLAANDTGTPQAVPYPQPWRSKGLPRIPDSNIVSQESGPAGTSHFEVVTTLSSQEVGEFLECELDPRWERENYGDTTGSEYENEFFDIDTEIIVTAAPDSDDPGSTRVDIVMRHYQPESVSPPTGFSSSHTMYSY